MIPQLQVLPYLHKCGLNVTQAMTLGMNNLELQNFEHFKADKSNSRYESMYISKVKGQTSSTLKAREKG